MIGHGTFKKKVVSSKPKSVRKTKKSINNQQSNTEKIDDESSSKPNTDALLEDAKTFEKSEKRVVIALMEMRSIFNDSSPQSST